jgi:hypothetical protein
MKLDIDNVLKAFKLPITVGFFVFFGVQQMVFEKQKKASKGFAKNAKV